MRSRRHRTRARRLRLKERVRRRYRKKQWRRVLVGLAVIMGVGLIVVGIGWGGLYVIGRLQAIEVRPADEADATPLAEPRLIGEWQSDPDASIAELRRTQALSAEDERDLRRTNFKTKVTYTEKMMSTEIDGIVERQPYQVVSQEGDQVVLSTWLSVRMQNEELRIRFVGVDRYWLEAQDFGETKTVAECFRRVH